MKLSAPQLEFIKLMQEGWEAGKDEGLGSGYGNPSLQVRLQKSGLGGGGECKYFRLSTYFALLRKGLVVSGEYHFPTTRIFLSEKGRNFKVS